MSLDWQVFEPVTEATILGILDEYLTLNLYGVIELIESSGVDSDSAIKNVDNGAATSRAEVCCSAT